MLYTGVKTNHRLTGNAAYLIETSTCFVTQNAVLYVEFYMGYTNSFDSTRKKKQRNGEGRSSSLLAILATQLRAVVTTLVKRSRSSHRI